MKALADGEVTYDEYRRGFDSFAACMAKAGFIVEEEGARGEVIQYSIPASAVDSSVEFSCYQRDFEQLDIMWQIAHEDESETAETVRNCLLSKSVEPKESLNEMLEQLDSISVSIDECQ